MNIPGVAKLLGTVEFSKVRSGERLVERINEHLPEDQKISIDNTGDDLRRVYNALPVVIRDELQHVTVLPLAESIKVSSDVRKASIAGQIADDKETKKGYLVLVMAVFFVVIASVVVVSYAYTVAKTGTMAESGILTTVLGVIGDVFKAFMDSGAAGGM